MLKNYGFTFLSDLIDQIIPINGMLKNSMIISFVKNIDQIIPINGMLKNLWTWRNQCSEIK